MRVKMVLQYSSIPVTNDDGAGFDVLTHGAGSANGRRRYHAGARD